MYQFLRDGLTRQFEHAPKASFGSINPHSYLTRLHPTSRRASGVVTLGIYFHRQQTLVLRNVLCHRERETEMALDPSVYRRFAALAESSKSMHSRERLRKWSWCESARCMCHFLRAEQLRQKSKMTEKESSGICAEALAKDAFGSLNYDLAKQLAAALICISRVKN